MPTQLEAPPNITEHQPSKQTSPGLGLLGVLSLTALSGLCPHAWSQSKDDADKSSDNSKSSAAALCPSGRNAFSKPYGSYLAPILEHIHADPDQRTKITAIVQSYRGRIEPLTLEYKQKNQEFLANVLHGQAPELIMGEQTALGRLYSEITLYYCQMSLEVRRTLNPEQIVRYEEFKRQQGWTSNASASAAAPHKSEP